MVLRALLFRIFVGKAGCLVLALLGSGFNVDTRFILTRPLLLSERTLEVLRAHSTGSWPGCVKESTPIAKWSWCVLPLPSRQMDTMWLVARAQARCHVVPCLLVQLLPVC